MRTSWSGAPSTGTGIKRSTGSEVPGASGRPQLAAVASSSVISSTTRLSATVLSSPGGRSPRRRTTPAHSAAVEPCRRASSNSRPSELLFSGSTATGSSSERASASLGSATCRRSRRNTFDGLVTASASPSRNTVPTARPGSDHGEPWGRLSVPTAARRAVAAASIVESNVNGTVLWRTSAPGCSARSLKP